MGLHRIGHLADYVVRIVCAGLIICTDEFTVLYSLAQVHFYNEIMYMQNIHITKLVTTG